MAIDREAWDARIRAAVEELTPQLLASSHDIHANPELAFREHRASARLADELEHGGFAVERGAGGLPTAVYGFTDALAELFLFNCASAVPAALMLSITRIVTRSFKCRARGSAPRPTIQSIDARSVDTGVRRAEARYFAYSVS